MAKAITGIEEKEKTAQTSFNFWAGKDSCWEKCHCTNLIKQECPAYKYQFLPCWEIEGTYCKLDDYGADGKDISICQVCRVYQKYGEGKPIQLKLAGRGISTSLSSAAEVKTN